MSSSSDSDDVVFVKEEFKVKYTGPFPVAKQTDGNKKDFCKCLKEKQQTSNNEPTSTGKNVNILTNYIY